MAYNSKLTWETAIQKKQSQYGSSSDAISTLRLDKVRSILKQRILDIKGQAEIAAFSHNTFASNPILALIAASY